MFNSEKQARKTKSVRKKQEQQQIESQGESEKINISKIKPMEKS